MLETFIHCTDQKTYYGLHWYISNCDVEPLSPPHQGLCGGFVLELWKKDYMKLRTNETFNELLDSYVNCRKVTKIISERDEES